MKKFFKEIDILKAMAALTVILIHVFSRYKGNSTFNFYFWDLIHFSVGAFVFCSGFLYANSKDKQVKVSEIKDRLLKIVKRIVVPYYEYVVLVILGSWVVGKLPALLAKVDWKYATNTIFLTSGVGDNWIPRLFVGLFVLMLVVFLFKKNREIILKILLTASLVYAAASIFTDINLLGKFNMIFGWLVIFLAGFFLRKNYTKKNVVKLAIISFVFLVPLFFIVREVDGNTGIFHSKYPPTLYFIAYNLLVTSLLMFVAIKFKDVWMKNVWVSRLMSFFSSFSYQIFFYHLIFMKLFYSKIKLGVIGDYLLITISTVLLVMTVSWVKARLKLKF